MKSSRSTTAPRLKPSFCNVALSISSLAVGNSVGASSRITNTTHIGFWRPASGLHPRITSFSTPFPKAGSPTPNSTRCVMSLPGDRQRHRAEVMRPPMQPTTDASSLLRLTATPNHALQTNGSGLSHGLLPADPPRSPCASPPPSLSLESLGVATRTVRTKPFTAAIEGKHCRFYTTFLQAVFLASLCFTTGCSTVASPSSSHDSRGAAYVTARSHQDESPPSDPEWTHLFDWLKPFIPEGGYHASF